MVDLTKLVDKTKTEQDIQNLRDAGYIPKRYQQIDWEQPLPLHKKDQIGEPPKVGLPEDWDYQSAKVGPDGQVLPRGAIGWTPHGAPFYGGNNGLANWWNGIRARINAPIADGGSAAAYKRGIEQRNQAIKDLLDGKFGQAFANGIGAIGSAVEAYKNFGTEEGEDASPLTKTLRTVGEGVSGVLNAAQEVAEEAEQIRGGFASAREAAGFGEDLSTQELIKNSQNGTFGNNTWFPSLVYSLNPFGIAKDIAGGTIGLLKGETQAFREGYESGRILYSTFNDAALKAEYVQRWRAGENPYLLAEELQNPSAELAGEILADPLNFIGIPIKMMRFTGRVDDASKLIGRLATSDMRRIFEGVDDASDYSKVAKAEGFVEATADAFKAREAGLVSSANSTGFWSLTDVGQRSHLGNTVGAFTHSIAGELKRLHPNSWQDEFLELVRGGMMLGGDAQSAQKGLNIVTGSGLPIEILLSETAMDTFVLMRKLHLDDAGKLGDLSYIQKAENAAEFIERFDKRFLKATEEMFHPLSTRIAVEEALASGNKAKIAEATKNFPQVVDAVNAGHTVGTKGRAFASAEKIARSKIVSGINNFFGAIYMGMSPGYVARNYIVDALTIFTDAGPRALGRRIKMIRPGGYQESFDAMAKLYGGAEFIPPRALSGFGAAASAIGSNLTEEATTLTQKVTRFGSRIAREAERKGTMTLFRTGVEQTMARAQKALMTESLESLSKAGVDTHVLDALMFETGFHPTEAAKLYREALADGSIDLLKTGGWMDEVDAAALKSYKRYDAYKSAIAEAGDDVAARLAAHDEFTEGVEEYARGAARHPAGLPKDYAEDGIFLAGEESTKGRFAATHQHLAQNQRASNLITEEAWGKVVSDARRAAQASGVDLSSIYSKKPEYYSLFRHKNSPVEHVQDVFMQQYKKDWDNKVAMYEKLRDGKIPSDDFSGIARSMGIEPAVADKLNNKDALMRYFWEGHYFPQTRAHFKKAREEYVGIARNFIEDLNKELGFSVSDAELARAIDATKEAMLWDDALILSDGTPIFAGAEKVAEHDDLVLLASLNDISTATKDGVPTKKLLNTINARLRESGVADDIADTGKVTQYENLADVPYDAGRKAIQDSVEEFVDIPRRAVPEAPPNFIEPGTEISKSPYGGWGDTPTDMRAHAEGMDLLKKNFDNLRESIETAPTKSKVFNSPEVERAINEWQKFASAEMSKARLAASQVGEAMTNFALHDYDARKNFDLALGLIYPYQFWHTRTMNNWLRRIGTNAGTIAAYAKYKDQMAEIHAGMPEWWKYNINSNELLGLDWENPLFLNLEATLNPLNGLTGVDFNDRYKRTGFITKTLDDMGKFGPTTWTPISIATGVALHFQGEEEAASRWAGRLIPQTQTLQSLANVAGMDFFELDPLVNIFSNGVDPYTRRRAGRALAAMIQENPAIEEAALEAAQSQSGELWTEALNRAVNERAPGQLSSFLLGVGFKARTISDLTIDQFDKEYRQFWNLRPDRSPQEFREGMEQLRRKYPFMDTVLLSRKGGPERDTALAWNTLNRLPPGSSSLTRSVGLPQELLSRFYDNKGDMRDWSDSDRERMMAAVIDMSAILAIPSEATRTEWLTASGRYKQVTQALEGAFGSDIENLIDHYFRLKDEEGDDVADEFLAANPRIENAMDLRGQLITSDPLTAAYYKGMDGIYKYYRGEGYSIAEEKFGSNIFDIQSRYFDLKDDNLDRAARSYLNANPVLKQYWDFLRDFREDVMFPNVVTLASKLPETKPAEIREDADPQSVGQEGLQEAIQQPQQKLPLSFWVDGLGEDNFQILQDAIQSGGDIPGVTQRKLQQLSEQTGLGFDQILQLFGQSIQ